MSKREASPFIKLCFLSGQWHSSSKTDGEITVSDVIKRWGRSPGDSLFWCLRRAPVPFM